MNTFLLLVFGLHLAPGDFLIAMIIDGGFYPTTKLLQGPDGDYIGAMRIEGAGKLVCLG